MSAIISLSVLRRNSDLDDRCLRAMVLLLVHCDQILVGRRIRTLVALEGLFARVSALVTYQTLLPRQTETITVISRYEQ